jgi:hypothetical protein
VEGFGEQLGSPRTPPTTLAVTSTGAVEPAQPLPPPGKAREMAWASGRYAARCGGASHSFPEQMRCSGVQRVRKARLALLLRLLAVAYIRNEGLRRLPSKTCDLRRPVLLNARCVSSLMRWLQRIVPKADASVAGRRAAGSRSSGCCCGGRCWRSCATPRTPPRGSS